MMYMQLNQMRKKVFILSACLYAENSAFRQLFNNFRPTSTVQGGRVNRKSAILPNVFVKHR